MTIGVLTYQRPVLLKAALHSMAQLGLERPRSAWRLCDILVVDNDAEPSARPIVEQLAADGFPVTLTYRHEPRPGLSAARNRALDEAAGDVLVFIDDDETAEPGWPDGLLEVMASTGAALVGGPVRTTFAQEPPAWVRDGGFFDRDEPPDATPQSWLRSGNLALDLPLLRHHGLRFDSRYGRSGGEDTAFSIRARQLGLGLQWSATAVVSETVGPERTTVAWLTRRERHATANWVRIELDEYPGTARRALILGRALVRLAQGAVLALAGAVSGRRATAVRGLIRLSRGVGALHGLVGGTSRAYGA